LAFITGTLPLLQDAVFLIIKPRVRELVTQASARDWRGDSERLALPGTALMSGDKLPPNQNLRKQKKVLRMERQRNAKTRGLLSKLKLNSKLVLRQKKKSGCTTDKPRDRMLLAFVEIARIIH
jgi:hypothetical protein